VYQSALETAMPLQKKKKDEDEEVKVAEDDLWPSYTKGGIPWYYPAVIGTGMAGAAGSWKLMDMLLDRRRRTAQEDELEGAQDEFEEALRGPSGKQASGEPTLGSDLDALYDLLQEKKAAGEFIGELGGRAIGGYATYGGISALLAGLWAYNLAKKSQKKTVLEKAKKERQRKTFERRPPSIEMFPSSAAST
jgi:hypothetical protein